MIFNQEEKIGLLLILSWHSFIIINDFNNLQIACYRQKSIGQNLSNFKLLPLDIIGLTRSMIVSINHRLTNKCDTAKLYETASR